MASNRKSAKYNSALKAANMTECAICFETYKDPRCLPCIHTFCLHCLEGLVVNSGNKRITCPMCREKYTIRAGDLKSLPSNFHIQSLIDIIKSTDEKYRKQDNTVCEFCADEENNSAESWAPAARWRCLDCQQNICQDCSRRHMRQNISKDHSLLDLDELGANATKNKPSTGTEKCKKKLKKSDIGLPTNFRHIQHIGWDPNTGFNLDGLDPSMHWLFQAAGVSDDQLTDKKTAKFIYKFIMDHGGLEAVQKEFETKRQCQ